MGYYTAVGWFTFDNGESVNAFLSIRMKTSISMNVSKPAFRRACAPPAFGFGKQSALKLIQEGVLFITSVMR